MSYFPPLSIPIPSTAADVPLHDERILFIGNSYTFGDGDPAVMQLGGIPKMLEAVAATREKPLFTLTATSGGKNWAWHLAQPETLEALRFQDWDWVVIQDFSNRSTRAGDPDGFLRDGEALFKAIRKTASRAKVALYEPWADPADSAFYGQAEPASFADPAQMTAELQKGHAALKARLQALDPAWTVLVVPVGTAFARSREKYPDIDLHAPDRHHGSVYGYYLSTLVFDAFLLGNDPRTAPREIPPLTLAPATAERLQAVVAEVAMQAAASVALFATIQG